MAGYIMFFQKRLSGLTFLAFFLLFPTFAKAASSEVYSRVVDVGAGLCVITRIPGDHFFLYDAGHWQNDVCYNAVREIVTTGKIDLMVLSHSDGDHIGNAEKILRDFDVKKIIWTGSKRPDSKTWKKMNAAIDKEAWAGATVINLKKDPVPPGTQYQLGDATVTFVFGLSEWTSTNIDKSEQRNAISIVVKLTYQGKSILFPGDTVGRRRTDPDTACRDAEKMMVDNSIKVPMKSEVLIAPHHGANNANSECFINAVDPAFVIFPAGHVPRYQHPTAAAAKRYIQHGVKPENMFRTDLGDDELKADSGKSEEWKYGAKPGCADKSGDDDVEIILKARKVPVVGYRDDGGVDLCGD